MSKGRDKNLVSARDRRIYERYYYWTEVQRLRFDDTITKLSNEEFYLSESRILAIIRQMIQEGVSVEGKQISKPLFTGFKVGIKPSPRKQQSSSARQLSLFPE
ncbi:MAG: transposase [Prevotella sp.]|nr:transposase [Prevotella sp.]